MIKPQDRARDAHRQAEKGPDRRRLAVRRLDSAMDGGHPHDTTTAPEHAAAGETTLLWLDALGGGLLWLPMALAPEPCETAPQRLGLDLRWRGRAQGACWCAARLAAGLRRHSSPLDSTGLSMLCLASFIVPDVCPVLARRGGRMPRVGGLP